MAGSVVPFGSHERRRRPRIERPRSTKSPRQIREEKDGARRERMAKTLRRVSPLIEIGKHSTELEEIGRMGDEDLALEAVQLLEDEKCLASVGRSCSKINVRKLAADKLAERIDEVEHPVSLCVVAKFSDTAEARLRAIEKLRGKEETSKMEVRRRNRGSSPWIETRRTILRDVDFYMNVFMFGKFEDTKVAIANQLGETRESGGRLEEFKGGRNSRILEMMVMHADRNVKQILDALLMVYAENPERSVVNSLANVGANHNDSEVRARVVEFCKDNTSLLRRIAVFTMHEETACEIAERTEDTDTLVSIAARGRVEMARIIAITELDKESLMKVKREMELTNRENKEKMDERIYEMVKGAIQIEPILKLAVTS